MSLSFPQSISGCVKIGSWQVPHPHHTARFVYLNSRDFQRGHETIKYLDLNEWRNHWSFFLPWLSDSEITSFWLVLAARFHRTQPGQVNTHQWGLEKQPATQTVTGSVTDSVSQCCFKLTRYRAFDVVGMLSCMATERCSLVAIYCKVTSPNSTIGATKIYTDLIQDSWAGN